MTPQRGGASATTFLAPEDAAPHDLDAAGAVPGHACTAAATTALQYPSNLL